MDEIFHKKPWVDPIVTLDSNNGTPSSSSNAIQNKRENKRDCSSPPNTKKSKRKYYSMSIHTYKCNKHMFSNCYIT